MEGQGGEMVRAVLRQRGYEFCDDRETAASENYREGALKTVEELQNLKNLIEEGVHTSSTDHWTQSIGNTLNDDMEFWSSAGSTFQDATESLTYRLSYPVCMLHAIEFAVYRAEYQFGEPLYPPRKLSIDIGPSHEQMHRVSTPFYVKAHSQRQFFKLDSPILAIGGYLRLWMEGKPQMQLADLQHFIAIRYVAAHGIPLPENLTSRIPRAISQSKMMLMSTYCPAVGLSDICEEGQRNILQVLRYQFKQTRKKDEEACDMGESDVSSENITQEVDHPAGGTKNRDMMEYSPRQNARLDSTSSRAMPESTCSPEQKSLKSSSWSKGLQPNLFFAVKTRSWPVIEFPEQIPSKMGIC